MILILSYVAIKIYKVKKKIFQFKQIDFPFLTQSPCLVHFTTTCR